MPPRIVYLATADARGHLMRAQLLTHSLRAAGASVQVLTTSDEGARFLAGFGIEAPVLSRHYAVQFDREQNMLRRETDRNVAHYVFRPERMLRDILRLRAWFRDADLVVNDSFHPALLFMGWMPVWRRKVVHVYGASLRHALQTNFSGRMPAWMANIFGRIVAWQIDRSRARIAHDFAYGEPQPDRRGGHRLATPVAVVGADRDSHDDLAPQAAVYLNPHFKEAALADGLERGLADAHMQAHLVGEGYAQRAGWHAQDEHWIERAARSAFIVSAPGMAALSVAAVYRKPILLLLTDQPEQAINAQRAAQMGLHHRIVVWQGRTEDFARTVTTAAHELIALANDGSGPQTAQKGREAAMARLQHWTVLLHGLAAAPPVR
ncbi:hypothetical protein J2W25_000117 [Variovorax boronicumulans]|uniref:Uncharacterized protein n=1 Tax=Variovorax boronicumulans TaxID=436515 RepID=A0AAW8DNV6_9BURK|nr:hypothetical protein [Variovorax boronicumulans]MDP9875829.1 hypothetical protein [Variovorax boronicumulans]MDP9921112.1 hypothetical protein [Variovorax boronicumulans]